MPDEYISREAAVKDFEANNARNPYWTPPRVKTLLLRQPTADVAEVVRCKDCKNLVNTTINANVFSSAISAIWRLRRKIFAATENGGKNEHYTFEISHR